MEEEVKKTPYNVWLISDLHFGHKNILIHQPNRVKAMGLKDNTDIKGHDEWLINMWNSTVKRGDHVYVLGDFLMGDYESSRKILHKLKQKGCIIHLVIGNHDATTVKFTDMFNSMDLIKEVTFKKNVFPFLEHNLICVMCHYPMKTWARKCHGSLNLFGHTHDNSPWEVGDCDLAINVGLDAPMANYGLIPLERISEWYKTKLNGLDPHEYINKCSKEHSNFIR